MSTLALLGGNKAKGKQFPVWPDYDRNEEQALKEVLESRVWWRTPGTKTLEFERAFAAFHGARHGIAVTNGTAALEVVMAALKAPKSCPPTSLSSRQQAPSCSPERYPSWWTSGRTRIASIPIWLKQRLRRIRRR